MYTFLRGDVLGKSIQSEVCDTTASAYQEQLLSRHVVYPLDLYVALAPPTIYYDTAHNSHWLSTVSLWILS